MTIAELRAAIAALGHLFDESPVLIHVYGTTLADVATLELASFGLAEQDSAPILERSSVPCLIISPFLIAQEVKDAE